MLQMAVAPNPADRRRCPRFRYSLQMRIRCAAGSEMPAMSLEINETGMSAATGGALKIGETVEIEPVAGCKMQAIVRYNDGKIYGFEFFELSEDHVLQIRKTCKNLPLYFTTLSI